MNSIQKQASKERLHAMAKHILKADRESFEWGNELVFRAQSLNNEDKLKLQEIINASES